MQRSRANDITPALLLVGHWVEILGWWFLTVHAGPLGWVAGALVMAVKFRHLQEVGHFAVHGVLTRTKAAGAVLTEVAVHAPLGFVTVSARRDKHVRRHHPNATVSGVDPNLAELHGAGLRPEVGLARFALALIFPLTPRGIAETGRGLATGLRQQAHTSWSRPVVFAVVPVTALLIGWPTLVFGLAVPRLLLYPQLAWMSLLVEHCWFDAAPARRPATVKAIEATRCMRLYPRNPLLALVARTTWLPYGDLFHYAHSVHPAVRWNYLPVLERILGRPTCTPSGVLVGVRAVIPRHRRALRRRPTAPSRAGQEPAFLTVARQEHKSAE
ncbi:hypothetical protein GCM10009780_00110 [Actinomadura alba]